MENRPSWNEYYKQLVEITAKRSPCKKLHVGCILVKDNRIISQGYNGYLPGAPHKQVIRNDHEVATVHAEQNALCDCAKRGASCNEAFAYITHYPCLNCMKLLVASGIKKIYYINNYNNDEFCQKISEEHNIPIEKL